MPMAPLPTAALRPVARFPKKYFLENLAVRRDGSILVSALHQHELWCVPRPAAGGTVDPVLVHTFDHLVTGILEVAPEVFIVSLSDLYTTREAHLVRVDLSDWTPGGAVSPELVLTFDDRVGGLNGSCLVAPGIMLIADCFAGLIWRIDLGEDARSAAAQVWLRHDTMAMDADSEVAPPPQPGVNGIDYGQATSHVYYTSTAQKVFMRVPVEPESFDPAGDAEFVAAIDMADDFCIDERAGFAYVSRHRANTIDRVPLTPRHGSEVRHIAGDPFDEILAGPSSLAWGREAGDVGRVAYVTTDGGTTAPVEGVIRDSKLLRLELTPGTSRGWAAAAAGRRS